MGAESTAGATRGMSRDCERRYDPGLRAMPIDGNLRRLRDRLVLLPLYVVLALARALPRSFCVGIGGWLGRVYARLRLPRTGVARRQLADSYPEWDPSQVRSTVVDTFGQFGKGLVETLRLLGDAQEDPRDWIDFEGLEHLAAARAASPGGGAILLTGHFGSWELFAAATARSGYPVSIVHRPNRNVFLDGLILRWRERAGIEVLERGTAGRAVLRALRRGRVVVMPLDQDAQRTEGVFVPFFGRPACTRDGPALLAMALNVAVVPAFIYRQNDGLRHRGLVRPALELAPVSKPPAKAVRENVKAMTRAIEDAIREAPDHWIWAHRRWRTQRKRD